MEDESLRQFGAIILVVGLLAVALWALRRAGWFTAGISSGVLGTHGIGAAVRGFGERRARTLESLERLPLTPQHSLHLIRMGEREFLVGTHPQGCVLLANLPNESGPGVNQQTTATPMGELLA